MPLKVGPNPWRTLGSRIVYEGERLKIRKDDVMTPSGTTGTYSIVVLPGTGNGCMIIPVSPSGELHVLGLWRYPTGRYSIEIPGGATEAGEESIETAKRELLEETGLVSSRWARLGSIDTLNGFSDSVNEIFLAENVEKVGRHDTKEMIEEGIDKTTKLSLTEAIRLVHAGTITHSLTIAALFLYVSHKGLLKQS